MMTVDSIDLLCAVRDLPYKASVLNGMSEEELHAGYMKFNIPDPDNLDSLNGEGVWGWMTPEDKAKYMDDRFHGELPAILCNTPINFYGVLWWGCEVVVQCHGAGRPTLSRKWIEEHILSQAWNNNEEVIKVIDKLIAALMDQEA